MNILAIAAIIYSIVLIVFAQKRLKGFNPASFFTLLWAMQILIMIIGGSNFLLFKYTGVFYILIAVTCFDMGYMVISPKLKNNKIETVKIAYNRQTCKTIYLFVLVFAFIGIFYNMLSNGFHLTSLFSLESFMEMSNENSLNRYSGGAAERSILTNILDVNGYACPLLGGLFFHYDIGKRKIWAFIGLLPCMLDGFVQGAKMGMITGVIMWAIGYIISSELLTKTIKLKLRHVIFIVLSVFAFFLILFMTMIFRYGEFNEETSDIVIGKVTCYSLGHLPAFDQWYDMHHDDINHYTFGGRTFNGITNPLGILKREGGVFDEPVDTSKYGDSTNVYTVFRFFVEDFGTIGSLIFLFFMGMICRIVYYNYLRRRNIPIVVSLLSMIYFFISWSFSTSIFAYTTYIVLTFYLYFVITMYFKKHYNPQSIIVHE